MGGSAPVEGGLNPSADVPVFPSTTVRTSVEDKVQTSAQPSNSGAVGSLGFNNSKARGFEQVMDLVLTPNAFRGKPSRESVQGLVKTCLERCAVDFSEVCSPALFNEHAMQLGLSTELAADLVTGWNLETKSRRDK